jgi:hypothetical protein
MKKLFIALSLTSLFSIQAFADCSAAYRKASHRRDIRNIALVVAGSFAVATPAIFIPGTVAVIGVLGYHVGLLGIAPSVQDWNNNFEEIQYAVRAAKTGSSSKYLTHITEKAAKEAGLEYNPELEGRVAALLLDGYESEEFCPVVKIGKYGIEKRAAFTQSAIINHLASQI